MYSLELTTPKELRNEKFQNLQTFKDLADLLEVTSGFLAYVMYSLEEKYTPFYIPKKSNPKRERLIYNPAPPLKFIQKRLNQILSGIYEPRCSAHGFIADKSVVTNAQAHKKNGKLKYVLNLDIENFFPSITFRRVRGLFRAKPYNLPDKIATYIAQIVCYNYKLPQGAPTSPIIANMICNKMDSQLQRLAESRRCTYTRYADDITFSTTTSRFPTTIARRVGGKVVIGPVLGMILEQNGFKVNEAKTRLNELTTRQEITGLTVNKFPNVPQKYIRQIRAMLHDWDNNGYKCAHQRHLQFRKSKSVKRRHNAKYRYPHKRHLTFREILRGKIEYLGMVRGKQDPIFTRQAMKYNMLAAREGFASRIEIKIADLEGATMIENSALIFISYAHEDKEVVLDLYKRLKDSGYYPWIDQEDIYGGEKWQLAIDKAIPNANLFLVILSPRSVNKRGVLRVEINKALDLYKQKLPDDIYILPLRIEECEPPLDLTDIQYIDYFGDDNKKNRGWNRLTQSIGEALKRYGK